jgi:hypothetical protein
VRAHVCRFRKNSRISLVLPEFFLKIWHLGMSAAATAERLRSP